MESAQKKGGIQSSIKFDFHMIQLTFGMLCVSSLAICCSDNWERKNITLCARVASSTGAVNAPPKNIQTRRLDSFMTELG
jgi:hypothetical protein